MKITLLYDTYQRGGTIVINVSLSSVITGCINMTTLDDEERGLLTEMSKLFWDNFTEITINVAS